MANGVDRTPPATVPPARKLYVALLLVDQGHVVLVAAVALHGLCDKREWSMGSERGRSIDRQEPVPYRGQGGHALDRDAVGQGTRCFDTCPDIALFAPFSPRSA
jgi:hypothetical protein